MVLWCVQINCIIGSCALIPLQSAIKASTGKGKKDKKKNKKATVDDQAEDLDGEAAPAPSKAPVEVTAEDLADEEWGPVKGKKGKKGKGDDFIPYRDSVRIAYHILFPMLTIKIGLDMVTEGQSGW